jgi:putative SOS response-associated peptidase YedK
VLSCALLSKAAAPGIVLIHDRMPVVLKPEHFDAWLDPTKSGADVQEIIADSRNGFDSYPVSTRVNNTRNDFQELLAPLKA